MKQMVSNRKTHHIYVYIYWTNQLAVSDETVMKFVKQVVKQFIV